MAKRYVKRGSFWDDRKRLGRIAARVLAGDTLAAIGEGFGTTRQNVWNVCHRHGIDIGSLRQKGRKKASLKIVKFGKK